VIRGITFSAFELLHPGHLMFLESARQQCDHLTVGLHVNPNFCNPKKSIPVETVFERYTRLRAVKWVDDIIPYETEDDLRNMIYSERFDIRFLGSDYALKDDYTARAVIDEKYIPRFHDYSSSNLKLRISDRDYSRPARELGVAFRR